MAVDRDQQQSRILQVFHQDIPQSYLITVSTLSFLWWVHSLSYVGQLQCKSLSKKMMWLAPARPDMWHCWMRLYQHFWPAHNTMGVVANVTALENQTKATKWISHSIAGSSRFQYTACVQRLNARSSTRHSVVLHSAIYILVRNRTKFLAILRYICS